MPMYKICDWFGATIAARCCLKLVDEVLWKSAQFRLKKVQSAWLVCFHFYALWMALWNYVILGKVVIMFGEVHVAFSQQSAHLPASVLQSERSQTPSVPDLS